MWRPCTIALCVQVNAVSQEQRVTPVEKVTELLEKLTIQVQEGGKRDAQQYDKFACFCKQQADAKQYSLAKSDSRIASLDASIQDLSGVISSLDEEIALKQSDVTKEQDESKTAQADRTRVFDNYQKEREELKDAVSAVGRALSQMRGTKSATEESLLQLVQNTQSKLAQLGLSSPGLSVLQDDPDAYKFRSDDIIAVLQELSRTFKAELQRLEEEEGAKSHDFNMVQGSRGNKIKAFESEIDKKESLGSAKAASKSEQQGSLDEETAARTSDQAFLDELTSTCESKASLWDQRSKARASEITALSEARGLLGQASNKYETNSKLVDLSQIKATSFLQIRHSRGTSQVIQFLRSHAKLLTSSSIRDLVTKLVSGDDHFVKVRQLIKDLISSLKGHAEAEATQKSFCDDQLRKAIEKRDEHKAKQEDSAASIDQTSAKIVRLQGSILDLGEEIAAQHKALNEMTELRNGEKNSKQANNCGFCIRCRYGQAGH